MATDISAILRSLGGFYDFAGRHVLSVGAGGGQLAAFGAAAGRVTAVERDPAAMDGLQAAVGRLGLEDRYFYWSGDFADCPVRADVVLFEFCLHEIDDPGAALDRALRLAPETVVLDHAPGSPWIYYGAEDEKAAASWRAVESRIPVRRQAFEGDQRFADFAELEAKVRPQGAESLRRIEPFRSRPGIVIPMAYAAALLLRPGA